MNRFLTFETTALKIDDSVFPCNTVNFSIRSNTVPVFDINGSLLYYAPNSNVQGKISTQFYLTGDFPDFCKAENQSEASQKIQFNNFFIPSAYLTELNFDVLPYQPIIINVGFDFYDGLNVLNTSLNDSYQEFTTGLSVLNGLGSRIVTSNFANSNDFVATDFSYSFRVERQPITRVRQVPRRDIPSRVALKKIESEITISANNINDFLTIYGNDAVLSARLSDNERLSNFTTLNFTGTIIDQNYSISDSNYGISKIRAVSSSAPFKRSILSIPYEIEDFSLKYATNNIPKPPVSVTDNSNLSRGRIQMGTSGSAGSSGIGGQIGFGGGENSNQGDSNNNTPTNPPSTEKDNSNVDILPEDSIWCRFIIGGYLASEDGVDLSKIELCRLQHPHITSVECQNINETENNKVYIFKSAVRQPIFIGRNLTLPISAPQIYDHIPYYCIAEIQMNKNFFNDLIAAYTPDTIFSIRYRDHDWSFNEFSDSCYLFNSTLNTVSWSEFKGYLSTAVANPSQYGNGSAKNPYRLVRALGG